MSDRDKHADSSSQLNGKRKSAPPFFFSPTEDYANKLSPTCPCAHPSLAPAQLWASATGLTTAHRALECRNKTNMLTVASCSVFAPPPPGRLLPPTDPKLEPGWLRTVRRQKRGRAVEDVREGGLNHVKNLILGFSLNQGEPDGSDRDYQNKTQSTQ